MSEIGPKNPDTIIIKNVFYPKGLREIDVWNYYQKEKSRILKETSGRDLMLAIMVDVNKPVLLRKGSQTKFIRLNPSNYDEVMHGRVITVYSTMKRTDDIAIIDIDCDNFRKAKIAALKTFEFVMQSIPILRTADLRFTGKEGFHIFCTLGRKYNIDSIRLLLKKFLTESNLTIEYDVEQKRRSGIPNLDLSPNKMRGAFITLHSLSIVGLRCAEVSHRSILSFNPLSSLIKT